MTVLHLLPFDILLILNNTNIFCSVSYSFLSVSLFGGWQLSPCELLNLRDKFRQAPPPNLPHIKYNEVEGYFGVLITLYHIRKLLSSHGIRPAYEMLEEKLKQGYVLVHLLFLHLLDKLTRDLWNHACLPFMLLMNLLIYFTEPCPMNC